MIIKKAPEKAISFNASKWLHTQFLVDLPDLRALFEKLSPFHIFSTMGLAPIGKNSISPEQFLEVYTSYINLMKQGIEPQDADFRFTFTALLTRTLDALQAIQTADEREMIRPIEPIIQLQLHRFDISKDDHIARPMVFGKNTISWGLQASFPQLYEDPTTREVLQVLKEPRFQNNELYKIFQSWVREYTMPTPLMIQGTKVNSSIRMGKQCGGWQAVRNVTG